MRIKLIFENGEVSRVGKREFELQTVPRFAAESVKDFIGANALTHGIDMSKGMYTVKKSKNPGKEHKVSYKASL